LISKYHVSVAKIIKDNSFEIIYTPKDPSELYVVTSDVNRPGLILSGYSDFFDSDRIEFLGLAEMEYLKSLSSEEKINSLKNFLSKKPVLLILTRGRDCDEDFLNLVKEYNIPLLRTQMATSTCMSNLISYLNVQLAERITRHGVLVEVAGEGMLILGDSGVGKSETALELIKRGHRLIADDAVEIRRVSERSLIGSAPDNIRHFIELRGVGVINARKTFGMGAVKMTQKIDMIVELEPWESGKAYDRLGLDDETREILGIQIPSMVVPVKPGRNLSIIIETAALNNRLKRTGYNAARELLHGLGMVDDIMPQKEELDIWHNY